MKWIVPLLAVLLTALALTGQTVTYSEHIAPILFEYCVTCHRPGEAGPFPLLSYADARKQAAQIADVTRRRYMPPWPPDPGYGDFAGARRLSNEQIRLIAKWVQDGAPPGDLAAAPEPPHFAAGWQLGEPDLVLRMPQAFSLPADSRDVFRNFVVPFEGGETRYVRAIEVRPGNKRVVHHANILIDRTRSLRHRDGRDGQVGFAGMEVEVESGEEFEPDSHFLFWKPGTVTVPEPKDMPWRLDPGTDLILNLHFQPSGKAESIQASLGLYFTPDPPKRFPILIQLEHDGALDIPPGAKDFTVTDHLKLPVPVEVLAIYPHAHFLGKRIEAWATLSLPASGAGGKTIPLLRISNWDINWQATYTYRQPVSLPAGADVAMRISYDNSAANPRNPHHPPQRVRSGNRGEDEMGHVWLQLLPRTPDDRLIVHQALMRRRLEKYPADFEAHYNLGAALESAGKEAEALPHLETAVRLRPASAIARNTYGAALMVAGRVAEAIAQFRTAIEVQRDYANSHFNLGRALAAQGDAAGAISELREFLSQRPNDSKAHYLLAGILTGHDQLSEALPHFRRAAELEPGNAEMQTNLGTALARLGDLPAAIAAFERALELEPGSAGARANLDRARAALARKRP
jgi:Flp pilus assembly protein TadD